MLMFAADRLREVTGANVLIVHHSGVHEDKRERGSNVLRGAADTVIKVSRDDNKLDIINHGPEGKQKDAEEFKTIKLETKKVYFEQGGNDFIINFLILNLREGDEDAEPEGEVGIKPGKSRKTDHCGFERVPASHLGWTRLALMTKFLQNFPDQIA